MKKEIKRKCRIVGGTLTALLLSFNIICAPYVYAGELDIGSLKYKTKQGDIIGGPRNGEIIISVDANNISDEEVKVNLMSAVYDTKTNILHSIGISEEKVLSPNEIETLELSINIPSYDGMEIRHFLWNNDSFAAYTEPIENNLNLTVKQSDLQLDLIWDKVYNFTDIEKYRIYEDEKLVDEVYSPIGGYTIYAFKSGEHTYQVKGVNADGEVVAISNLVKEYVEIDNSGLADEKLPNVLFPDGVSYSWGGRENGLKLYYSSSGIYNYGLSTQIVGADTVKLLTATKFGLMVDNSYIDADKKSSVILEISYIDNNSSGIMVDYVSESGKVISKKIETGGLTNQLKTAAIEIKDANLNDNMSVSDSENIDIALYSEVSSNKLYIKEFKIKNSSHRIIGEPKGNNMLYAIGDTSTKWSNQIESVGNIKTESGKAENILPYLNKDDYVLISPEIRQ